MGWFWADSPAPTPAAQSLPPSHPHPYGASGTPPAGCPMHKRTVDAMTPPSSCPVSHPDPATAPSTPAAKPSLLSNLNPLNYMFKDLSQAPAPNQAKRLPTERENSTIPKGTGDGNWEYPSPQQMYNALLRKGYTDTDVDAVESMVAVHNFLNEGAWSEIVDWERRFGRGLVRGWQISKQGEENAELATRRFEVAEGSTAEPTLIRFQGRPKEMTPKAAVIQMMARVWPSKFGGTEPPFDRHDWFVSRKVNGQEKQVRYVIDYYTGPPEPTGEPVFFLDVRPAVTPTAAVERLMRWGGDVWWRASGAAVRDPSKPMIDPLGTIFKKEE